MKKVLVCEIGQTTIVLNAFGDLDLGKTKLLGQVDTPLDVRLRDNTGVEEAVKKALYLLEVKMGSLQETEWETYRVTSLEKGACTEKVACLLSEEVGEILILNCDEDSTSICMTQKARAPLWGEGLRVYQDAETLVEKIGNADIESRYGADWRSLIRLLPKSEQEIAFQMELTTQALKDAILNLCSSRDLTQLRWVVGTGRVLTDGPRGMEIIKESLNCVELTLPEEGYPILIDQYSILPSIGVVIDKYRDGAWQILLESLGVDS